ncbi:MAG: thioredoxin family protein, partial [Desulfobacterales bacterium]
MQIILTDSNFQKEVLECPQPVVVEFSADWSGACHIMAPMIEELAKEFKGQIKMGKLDIDDNELIARRYGICDLPTFLFFKNGQVIDHIIGAIP